MMKVRILLLAIVACSGCSSLGFTNEDAGLALMSGDVSVPANGAVRYTVERMPDTSDVGRAWNREMGVSRSALSWFGLGGPKIKDAGNAKQRMQNSGGYIK